MPNLQIPILHPHAPTLLGDPLHFKTVCSNVERAPLRLGAVVPMTTTSTSASALLFDLFAYRCFASQRLDRLVFHSAFLKILPCQRGCPILDLAAVWHETPTPLKMREPPLRARSPERRLTSHYGQHSSSKCNETASEQLRFGQEHRGKLWPLRMTSLQGRCSLGLHGRGEAPHECRECRARERCKISHRHILANLPAHVIGRCDCFDPNFEGRSIADAHYQLLHMEGLKTCPVDLQKSGAEAIMRIMRPT